MPDPLKSPTPGRSSHFAVDQRDCAAIVAVEGDLDLASAPQLKATLNELLRGGEGRIVLDFSRVPFMDSTALSALIGVHRRLAPDERIAVAEAHPQVLRVFELSGLATTFRIFPTVDAAIAYVSDADSAEPTPAAPPMTADAALMVGIATTAMPFAESEQDQVERWLRVLRNHGEAAVVLGSLGVSEASVREVEPADEPAGPRDTDPVAAVTEQAGRIALQRRGTKIATTDVLLAVMHEYGATFDRVLAAHGGDVVELAERLATPHEAAA